MPDAMTDKQAAFVTRFIAGPVSIQAAGTTEGFVVLQKARLRWEGTRRSVADQLRQLAVAITELTRDEPWAAEAAGNTSLLFEMLDTFDARLGDALDDALNASNVDLRTARLRTAKGILKEYTDYLRSDPIFEELDENPFRPVSIRRDLTAVLGELERQIA